MICRVNGQERELIAKDVEGRECTEDLIFICAGAGDTEGSGVSRDAEDGAVVMTNEAFAWWGKYIAKTNMVNEALVEMSADEIDAFNNCGANGDLEAVVNEQLAWLKDKGKIELQAYLDVMAMSGVCTQQELEIFCNYGVLAAEKRKVYTYGSPHSLAACSDKMTVAVPDDWKLYKNSYGAAMVKAPWGEYYEINDVLQGNENPCFYALDGDKKGHRVYLEKVKE